jgi:hypothetical protein
MAVADGDFDRAQQVHAEYRRGAVAARPVLAAAEPYSLFDPANHRRHFERLRQLDRLATAEPVQPQPK